MSITRAVLINLDSACNDSICQNLQIKLGDHIALNHNSQLLKNTSIYIENSNIPQPTNEVLQLCPNLERFILTNCNVQEIPADQPWNSTVLNFLYLSENKIKTLPKNGFTKLPILEYLWLDNNLIENLKEFPFRNLTKLLWLALNDNNITELPAGVFDNVPNIRTILLNRNKLEKIPNGVFDKCENLYQVNLAENHLKTIDENAFQNMKGLNSIDISRNYIQMLSLNAKHIEYLYAENAGLQSIHINAFIQTAFLRDNQINDIYFSNPRILRNLILTNNSLSDLCNISVCIHLEILDLAKNPIKNDTIMSLLADLKKIKHLRTV